MSQGVKGLVLALALFVFSGCTIDNQAAASGGNNEASAMSELDQYNNLEGWSGNGTLTVADPQKRAKVFGQADFKKTGQYTVQFSVQPPKSAPSSFIEVRAKATVTWSVEGNYVSRQISLYDGASISGVGQAAKIVIEDASIVGFHAGPVTYADYDVSWQVAPGTRPSQNQPPVLNLFGTWAPGQADALIALPQNVGAISTFIEFASDPVFYATDVITVEILDSATVVQAFSASPGVMPQWRPIPPGAQTIKLTRSNTIGQSPRININLGIDG
jgi:hypothetical protein